MRKELGEAIQRKMSTDLVKSDLKQTIDLEVNKRVFREIVVIGDGAIELKSVLGGGLYIWWWRLGRRNDGR